MDFITGDEDLRRYIPNVMRSLPGDVTLYDRMKPWLQTAQLFVERELIGDGMADLYIEEATGRGDVVYDLMRRAVALRAWHEVIPSLDIVVTANGLAAVETKTTKPASKAKIDRLLESVGKDAAMCMIQLQHNLCRDQRWQQSEIGRLWTDSLFPLALDLLPLKLGKMDSGMWDQAVIIRDEVKGVQAELERRYTGKELMEDIVARERMRIRGERPGPNPVMDECTRLLQLAVRNHMRDGQSLDRKLSVIEGMLRVLLISKGDTARRWRETTEQGQYYCSQGFRNNKEGTAYFF